ncbi:hypothetical protein [Arthrobacter sp. ISL-95]|uniref:hypothetical protein n=1 Tax=Arthrobacter sp. ISL-95 TaxID=2819116 RepID=UPI001BE9F6B1|nr:hypothetical protein [Arthrobacter sp. ISL-95]MBT2587823.1 hypothetical protein [Arthrobacter sp. ISL-95]
MRPKQDSTAFARMMAQTNAETNHPKPDDGKIVELDVSKQPFVRVSEVYGRAIKYTRSYGLVEGVDDKRAYHVQWFPAGQIKRVDQEAWRGRPL